MVDCLEKEKYPTFHEIREANKKFRPLLISHGRLIDDVIHTQEQWEKLQKILKLIETIDGVGLTPLGDTKQRQIVPIKN